MLKTKLTSRIALLYHEVDTYAARVVEAALCRSFTASQVEACRHDRFNDSRAVCGPYKSDRW